MIFSKRTAALIGALIFITNCTPKATGDDAASCSGTATVGAASGLTTTTNSNTIPIYVADPATTGAIGYPNEPLVSVTVCTPNHTLASQCATISNVLIDTGSFGLRLFASAIPSNVAPVQQTVMVAGSTYNLGECEVFGTGADWGGIENVDVQLGNQTVSNTPIQVINNGLPLPDACGQLKPDASPCAAGYNGIIGVGPFIADCGTACNSSTPPPTNPGNYFACTASSCGNVFNGSCSGGQCAVQVPVSSQVSNPVALMSATYNNGLSITFSQSVGAGGNAIQGSMTMGIGAAAGNTPTSAAAYAADPAGMTDGDGGMDFRTSFAGTNYGVTGVGQAFIDSGSNGLFFPQASTANPPECSGSMLYCPLSPLGFSATIRDYNGLPAPGTAISFTIGDADTIFNSGATASAQLGGNVGNNFDWGLPFFFGRTVYVGFDGKTASGFTNGAAGGPFWGF